MHGLREAGKTAEAQADLKRLEEIKKRREEARLAREEDLRPFLKGDRTKAGKAVAEEDAKAVGKAALQLASSFLAFRLMRMKELKQAMGKEEKAPQAAKGSDEKEVKEKEEAPKKQTINGADISDMYSFVATETKVKEEGSRFQATDGSIEACREAEADFM